MPRFDSNGASEGTSPSAAADGAVAILDPSRLRRECLRLAFSQHSPDRHVIEATTAEEVIGHVSGGGDCDLVLIGAATSEHIDLTQLDALRRALPDTPLVVVAEIDNPHRIRQVLGTGARGFLPASLSLGVVMGAIDLVLAGGVYVPAALIDSGRPGAEPGAAAGPEPWAELTRRQRDVLGLISQGKSNKLIADALTMSESTVKAHVKQIIRRLNVANRTQAALVATGRARFTPRVAESLSPAS